MIDDSYESRVWYETVEKGPKCFCKRNCSNDVMQVEKNVSNTLFGCWFSIRSDRFWSIFFNFHGIVWAVPLTETFRSFFYRFVSHSTFIWVVNHCKRIARSRSTVVKLKGEKSAVQSSRNIIQDLWMLSVVLYPLWELNMTMSHPSA